jgi:hypothetical protein
VSREEQKTWHQTDRDGRAALAHAMAAREAMFNRLEWQLGELLASLERAAAFHAATAAELNRPVPFVW